MHIHSQPINSVLLISVLAFVCHMSLAQSTTGKTKMEHATGTFDVKITPQKPDNPVSEEAKFGRMTIDKQFHGDLDATSKGEMLAGMTDVKGSAGYVALERVTGSLKGHTGSFILQHTGSMDRGAQQLTITVVPDSGTGQLTGLKGQMKIIIAEGKHSYEFDYSLPQQ